MQCMRRALARAGEQMIMALADRSGELIKVTVFGEESQEYPGLYVLKIVEGIAEVISKYRKVLSVARWVLRDPRALQLLVENDIILGEEESKRGYIRFTWK